LPRLKPPILPLGGGTWAIEPLTRSDRKLLKACGLDADDFEDPRWVYDDLANVVQLVYRCRDRLAYWYEPEHHCN
jgi:hypothetical protein